MSAGLDVIECVGAASVASATVIAASRAVACTASDGSSGVAAVQHLELVDSASDTPFDYSQAFGFWGLAFTSVVALYFACHGIGRVLEMIRSGRG